MTARRMRLGLSIRGHGYHPAAWRHPDVPADGTLHVEHYVQSAQTAERGRLDMIFGRDGLLVIACIPMSALMGPSIVPQDDRFEPADTERE